jgi:RNA-directed DNA polymerase
MEKGLKEFVESIPLENQKSNNSKKGRRDALGFIRYADDFVLIHKDVNTVLKCKEYLTKWLSDIGLELKPSKTRLTHTLDANKCEDGKAGFDFLGFHIQQFPVGKHRCSKNTHGQLTGFITLITPTKDNCKTHQLKIRGAIRKHRNSPQKALISELNPIIIGWANYYRHSDIKTIGVSSKQDNLMYLKLRRWAKRRCKNKTSRGYAKYWHDREYTMLNGNKSVRKEFCTVDETNSYRLKFHSDVICSSTDYVKVQGMKSPYDGNVIYWSKRMGKNPEISNRVAKLIQIQKGRCNECGLHFREGDVMEVDHKIPRKLGGRDEYKNLQILHRHCHDNKTRRDDSIMSKESKREESVH